MEGEEEQTMETLLNPQPPSQKEGIIVCSAVSERRDIIIFQFVQAVSSVFPLDDDRPEPGGGH